MNDATSFTNTPAAQFLFEHGLPLVFAAVFVEQAGAPAPAVPWLLAAGALSAAGKFNLPLGLGAGVLACLLADSIWFYLGRYRGNQVLGLLCRISLEPDSCVRRTHNVYTKYGLWGVLMAKFLPGVGTLVPPLAGMSKTRIANFLAVDAVGSVLYVAPGLVLGYFFNRQVDQILAALSRIGGGALALVLGLIVVYVIYKYWQRHRLLHELQMARVTVHDLRGMLQGGEAPLIFDLRSKEEVAEDPSVIQGAIQLSMDDVEKRLDEFPKDREIVVYCSCPNEVSSARLALRLQRKGFARVRPLLGGIDAWREQKYPLELRRTVLKTSSPADTPLTDSP